MLAFGEGVYLPVFVSVDRLYDNLFIYSVGVYVLLSN